MLQFKILALMNSQIIPNPLAFELEPTVQGVPRPVHHYQDLIRLFNQTFCDSENTVLVKGSAEPIYLPADNNNRHHRIIFAHGYFASALHEIAHWTLAGKERRLLEDYGYWYCPDGRDETQQAAFEHVEIKPQAIEWAFSVACAKPFSVSTDNLNGAAVDVVGFTDNVRQQVYCYLARGFPPRAQVFMGILQQFYGTNTLSKADFSE